MLGNICAAPAALKDSPLVVELMHFGTFNSSWNLFPYLITGKSWEKVLKHLHPFLLSTGVSISNSSSYIVMFT